MESQPGAKLWVVMSKNPICLKSLWLLSRPEPGATQHHTARTPRPNVGLTSLRGTFRVRLESWPAVAPGSREGACSHRKNRPRLRRPWCRGNVRHRQLSRGWSPTGYECMVGLGLPLPWVVRAELRTGDFNLSSLRSEGCRRRDGDCRTWATPLGGTPGCGDRGLAPTPGAGTSPTAPYFPQSSQNQWLDMCRLVLEF